MLTTQTAQRSFSFYLLPGFSLQAFSCAVEVLRLANEAIGKNIYSWQVISEDGQPVMSSCRTTVGIDSTLRDERERTQKSNSTSAAVICGGSAIPRPNKQLDAWLRECRMRRIPLVCIGSGTLVVARAGLADGR
ncbi:MAG: AraC family transcriptional regulator, partial [Mesorhizobium sp.]